MPRAILRLDPDAHCPLTAKDDLARIPTWQDTLALSRNQTVHFENIAYQIQAERPNLCHTCTALPKDHRDDVRSLAPPLRAGVMQCR